MDLSMKKSLPLAGILCAARISSALAATKGVFSTATDSAYQTPIPPNDLFPINPEHVFVTTVVLSIIAVVFLILAVRDGRKFRSTVPVALVLGGAANVIPESVDNYLGGVYWAQSHVPSDIMFVLMGREFDWYITVIWWVYAAGVRYLFYASLMRRSSTKKLWLCMALAGLADFVLEEVLLSYGGIYTYYGNQPLVLFRHFPCWWAFVNVSGLFLSSSIAYRFRDWLSGWRSVLILFLMPFCYIGAFSFCGMPAIFAINGIFSPAVIQLLGIATCIVAVIHTAGVMKIVLGRNPFSFRSTVSNSIAHSSHIGESLRSSRS